MIKGLGGVLLCASEERFSPMRDFYIHALGLAPRSDRPGFVNFELGDQRLTVAVHSDVDSANSDPLHVMINLLTDDISNTYSRALAHGAESLRPPEREKWGGMVATLQDPDGNVVQLMQLP